MIFILIKCKDSLCEKQLMVTLSLYFLQSSIVAFLSYEDSLSFYIQKLVVAAIVDAILSRTFLRSL